MRVVLTGISGLRKKDILGKICLLCNEKERDNCDFDQDVSFDEKSFDSAYVDKTFDLEHEMCKREDFRVPNYLDISEDELLRAKNRTLNYIIEESEGNENVILGMHSSYYRKNSLFSVIDWNKLREYKPNLFITLLDDIHSIKKRIQNNENSGEVKYIPMKDLLWWREVEILISQQISRNLNSTNIPHYILAREQAITLLYQLMFEPTKKKAYASYPVTAAKKDPDIIKETSNFIKELKKRYIVFDPMTIGEKKLQNALIENLKSPHPKPKINVTKKNGEEIECDVADVMPIISAINGQIVSRDERLVLQSDMVIGYRPTLSPGAQHELRYAKSTSRVETYIVHPLDDSTSPFVNELADEVFPSIEKLFERLDKNS